MLIGVMVDVVGNTAQIEQEVRNWPLVFLFAPTPEKRLL